ncbi:hypothetical protein Agub_g1773, partial [Astrephomene gubernaculifera]
MAAPALLPPAGLTSGMAHVAHDRWDPVKESNDYSEHVSEHRVRPQIALPAPNLTMGYTNEDIDLSHPSNRPILACNGLPRNFKVGSRCINPLEPRYVLPGTSPSRDLPREVQSPVAGAASRITSPKPHISNTSAVMGSIGDVPPSRSGSERLLVPAMSLPRGNTAGPDATAPSLSPKLQPLTSTPGTATAATVASPTTRPSTQSQHHQQQPHQQPQHHQQPQQLAANPLISTNGAVGGLLLYGPTAPVPPAWEAISAAAAGNRCLDVADINGQRRSSTVPPRRNGGFDPLFITDIVPPRKSSPTRALNSLTTGDIRGAASRPRTRDVPSPGRGTLNSADITGASPGCLTRPSPTTFALGRWPAPSVPQYHFSQSTRVTLLKKP